MKNIENAISKVKYALAHLTSIRLDQLDQETLDQLVDHRQVDHAQGGEP